jgi:hypothetical protein
MMDASIAEMLYKVDEQLDVISEAPRHSKASRVLVQDLRAWPGLGGIASVRPRKSHRMARRLGCLRPAYAACGGSTACIQGSRET